MPRDGTILINRDLPFYPGIVMAVEGECRPCGTYGSGYEMTKERLKRLVETYDPIGVMAARLSVDHDEWEGPALGVLVAARYEEADGKGRIVGDWANVDHSIAAGIDQGRWLDGSMTWKDADFFAELLEMPREKFLFYGKYDMYITHFTMLGQSAPAMPGMGPFPKRAVFEIDDERPEPAYTLDLAASTQDTPSLRATHSKPKEEPVPDDKETQGTQKNSSTPPEGAGETVEELRARNEQLQKDKEALEGRQSQENDGEMAQLKAQNQQLQADVARLSASDRAARVDQQVASLYASGSLTPAQEPFVREYLGQHLDASAVRLQAGQERAYAEGKDAVSLLVNILKNQPQIPAGQFAAQAHSAPAGSGRKHLVTDEDRITAKQMGLKPEEIAAERLGVAIEEVAA